MTQDDAAPSQSLLVASAIDGRLDLSIGAITGVANIPDLTVKGSARMTSQDPLAAFDAMNGKFDVVFNDNGSCLLTLKDYSDLLVTMWDGKGVLSGLRGSFSGSWILKSE